DNGTWCACTLPCVTAADCPIPSTGDVTPACEEGGRCLLACDASSRCPDGQECMTRTDRSSVCMARFGVGWRGCGPAPPPVRETRTGPPAQARNLRRSAPTVPIPSRGDGALSTNGIAARCLVSHLAGGRR